MADNVVTDITLDTFLKGMGDIVDKVYLCSQVPTTLTEAKTTYALASVSATPFVGMSCSARSSPTGRQIPNNVINNIVCSASGTVTAVAFVADLGSIHSLIFATNTASKSVTNGSSYHIAVSLLYLSVANET